MRTTAISFALLAATGATLLSGCQPTDSSAPTPAPTATITVAIPARPAPTKTVTVQPTVTVTATPKATPRSTIATAPVTHTTQPPVTTVPGVSLSACSIAHVGTGNRVVVQAYASAATSYRVRIRAGNRTYTSPAVHGNHPFTFNFPAPQETACMAVAVAP